MSSFLFSLIMCVVSSVCSQAADTETRFRSMVDEVKAAVHGETPDRAKLEGIIAQYCNMDVVCTNVARSYLLQKTKGIDAANKKEFMTTFLETFKPVYTAYLARVWTSESNREVFKEYNLENCQVKGVDVTMTFVKNTDQKSYIMLVIDDNGLIVSIKFGKDKQNMVDPIAADQGSCQAGVSNGEKPEDIFSAERISSKS